MVSLRKTIKVVHLTRSMVSEEATVRQLAVLLAVAKDDGIDRPSLMQDLRMSGPVMTRCAQSLLGWGLISIGPDSADPRIHRIWLTSKGKQLRKAIEEV